MKLNLNRCFGCAAIASLAGLLATYATGQTFTNLHTFAGGSGGGYPGGLVLSGDSLYGTTIDGGASGSGTVFKVNADGTGFAIIYSFTAATGVTNADGGAPWRGVIISSNTLYGTARLGGSSGNGTVFKVNTDGTGFVTLHNFSETSTNPPYANADGSYPEAGLTLSGTALYGTTYYGGTWGNGTVFKVNTDGTGFQTLHSFSVLWLIAPYTNYDGASPAGGLVVSGSSVYGTTVFGGAGNGTVFKVNTDGTGFAALYSFSGGADGASPYAALALSSNTLYGTTSSGGLGNGGTVFRINPDGTNFKVIHTFTGLNTNNANGDGANPMAGLIVSGDTLYGTAYDGGGSGSGTVFKVNTDGTAFGSLHSFGTDGALPVSGLVLWNNTLYGTATVGGSNRNGEVFGLLLTPQLTIRWIPAGPHVRLLWSTNATGYNLQANPDLASSVWTNVSPAPVISAGQNAVTQPFLGTRIFYRLNQQ